MEVPDKKFGIRSKGHRFGWNVNERIVGQVRFPQHSPARANGEEVSNVADIDRTIGREMQQIASVQGIPFSFSVAVEGYDRLRGSVALYVDKYGYVYGAVGRY